MANNFSNACHPFLEQPKSAPRGPPDAAQIADYLTYTLIIPTEMVAGFIVQTLNFILLRRSRIRGLRYTVYLRALCVTYLISIVTLVPIIVTRNGISDSKLYWQVFYTGHMQLFVVNLFLQAGNLLIVALAIEPLRALLFPFKNLTRSSGGKRNIIVVSSLYLVVFIICIPMLLMHYVVECPGQNYAVERWDNSVLATIRSANAVVFELVLIMLILVVYSILFLRYFIVQRKHLEHTTGEIVATRGTRTQQNVRHQRATAMCLGSITAFLLCNLPSAMYECVVLHYGAYRNVIFKNSANIFLVFNYTLNFLMQCLFSDQYRKELCKIVCRRTYSEKRHQNEARTTTMNNNAEFIRRASVRTLDRLKQSDTAETLKPEAPLQDYALPVVPYTPLLNENVFLNDVVSSPFPSAYDPEMTPVRV